MPTVNVKPVTRVEGHLELEATVETVGGVQQVVDARCAGTMFRGFETLLEGREPRDASVLTQRICGVCPISHGLAASLCLESAMALTPPANGRILRNLVLGANFLQSHVLHFYHLAALDYVDTTGLLDRAPWAPRHVASDMVSGAEAKPFVEHYVQALALRRTAHRMAAVFGGKLPCSPALLAGGSTAAVTADALSEYRGLLGEVRDFVVNVYQPDVAALAQRFAPWATLGRGCGNLLAFGAFDLDAGGANKLLPRGRLTNGSLGDVDPAQVAEDVGSAFYGPDGSGPAPGRAGAYSWIKAPRYAGEVHEVGPLARLWVSGEYRTGISVMDRHAARALEAGKLAQALEGWLGELRPGEPAFEAAPVPREARGVGLTEAPRGALGHWLELREGLVARYRVVPPTTWNASPRDDRGRRGPMEEALVGTPVRDLASPVELLRVIHSFDPCLSCAVHVVRAAGDGGRFVVHA